MSDFARRLQQIETAGEAQRALTKSSGCDLRVPDVETAIARVESAVIGARGKHDKALLAEKTCLMQMIDQLKAPREEAIPRRGHL